MLFGLGPRLPGSNAFPVCSAMELRYQFTKRTKSQHAMVLCLRNHGAGYLNPNPCLQRSRAHAALLTQRSIEVRIGDLTPSPWRSAAGFGHKPISYRCGARYHSGPWSPARSSVPHCPDPPAGDWSAFLWRCLAPSLCSVRKGAEICASGGGTRSGLRVNCVNLGCGVQCREFLTYALNINKIAECSKNVPVPPLFQKNRCGTRVAR